MNTYSQLELNEFYLIEESQGTDLKLLKPIMRTEKAVLIEEMGEQARYYWKRSSENFYEIIEKLDENQVIAYMEATDEWEGLDFDPLDEWDEE